ncbi:trypsin-like serine protease [Pseudoalteromonas sp. OANN1]|uniref:trypsin-like serine protease n=1 Tax=Pseudoalteromonas sp. OANN1 TaxID=2954497 RepID=UPI00209841DE|nr:trypsin-like serine protease [Pseudoalteromonas sp. OANN1]MCO7197537.1 trypsin-like serine protease [Pseudoalteromonas sp. OANN1]
MNRVICALSLLGLSLPSMAIVTRHDVSNTQYLVDQAPEFLIDMPGEGHGVLINPNWIVTVAHLIFSDYRGKEILIHGKPFIIEEVIIHENARKPDSKLFKGDAKPLMEFNKSTSDIALIKLAEKVTQVDPIELYRGTEELGSTVTAFGRGSTGDGKNGSIYETKREKVLRKMENRIDNVEGNWISMTLDDGDKALPLEGIDGSGDSGGPLIMMVDGKPELAGLFSWDYVEGDLQQFKHGLYGGKSYQVRISRYVEWIEEVMAKSR